MGEEKKEIAIPLSDLIANSGNHGNCDLSKILVSRIQDPKYDENNRLIVEFPIIIENIRQPFPSLQPITLSISIQNIVFTESFKLQAKYEEWNKIYIKLHIRNSKFNQLNILHSTVVQFECYHSEFSFLSLSQSTFTNLIIGNSNKIVRSDFYRIKALSFFINSTKFQGVFQCLGSTLDNVKINECTFEDECLFYKPIYENSECKLTGVNKDSFTNNTFKKKVIFTGCELDTVHFTKTKFEGEADFKDSTLTNCDFSFTRFMGEADFKRVKFHGKNIFEYTQFNDRGAFKGAYFDNDPEFNKLILGSTSQMYFSQLNKNLDTNENLKPINRFTITDTIINGRMDLDDNNINILDMKGCVIAGTLSRVQFNNITCANWETATLLKNEELKQNNLIRALEYKAEEKELYENELWRKIKHHLQPKRWKCLWKMLQGIYALFLSPLFIIFLCDKKELNKRNLSYTPLENEEPIGKSMFDLISLWLSKIANNHGQSWRRGIVFTTTVWFVCFGMFYIPFPFLYDSVGSYIDTICWLFTSGQFFSNMVEYFNPTNYELLTAYFTDRNVCVGVKFFGTIWYLLGKALIPYGAFEVVQAFRKYNKID